MEFHGDRQIIVPRLFVTEDLQDRLAMKIL
jgi:hypothetical protein